MWDARKSTFLPLHKKLKRETRLSREEDSFSTVTVAKILHDINPNMVPVHPLSCGAFPGIPNGANLSADFDAHFDNLATTITHGNGVVHEGLRQLTQSSAAQHNNIKKLLGKLRATIPSLGGRNNPATGGGRNNLPATDKEKLEKHISQLNAAVRFKWIPGNFCFTHGHGVIPDHNSARCNKKFCSDGHVATATRKKPFGPGGTRNKGRNDWIMKS